MIYEEKRYKDKPKNSIVLYHRFQKKMNHNSNKTSTTKKLYLIQIDQWESHIYTIRPANVNPIDGHFAWMIWISGLSYVTEVDVGLTGQFYFLSITDGLVSVHSLFQRHQEHLNFTLRKLSYIRTLTGYNGEWINACGQSYLIENSGTRSKIGQISSHDLRLFKPESPHNTKYYAFRAD